MVAKLLRSCLLIELQMGVEWSSVVNVTMKESVADNKFGGIGRIYGKRQSRSWTEPAFPISLYLEKISSPKLIIVRVLHSDPYGEDVSFPAHNLGSYPGRLVHDEDQDFLFGMPQRRRTFPPSSLYAYVAIEEWRRIGSGVGFCA